MSAETRRELAKALITPPQTVPEWMATLIGPQGPEGAEGVSGPEGPEGPQGVPGIEGPIGPEGPHGPEGPIGPLGPKGDTGKDGKVGPKGTKGDKGEKGDPGKDGGIVGGRGGGYNVRGLASGMVIDDEGTKLNSGAVIGELDFAGAGVSVALVGGKAVATIPGGGGGTTVTVAQTDPGAIGAHNLWAEDVFGGEGGYTRLWLRNATDDGWLALGPVSYGDGDESRISSPDDNAELGLGNNGQASYLYAETFRLSGNGPGFFFDSAGIHLGNNSGGPLLLTGSADPSAGGGVAAPVGSVYLRTDGTFSQKTGVLDTDWTLFGAGGGGPSPATTVTDETTYDLDFAVGTGTEYARDDHTHGSPPTPTPFALADVLAVGNDVGGHHIVSAGADGGTGADIRIDAAPGGGDGATVEITPGQGADGHSGGYLALNGGSVGPGGGNNAQVAIGGATPTDNGYVGILTDGTFGNAGQVLQADGATGSTWATPAAGLPSQWSTGTGHGDVTAETDDVGVTALTIKKMAGQTGALFAVDDESDATILELERHIDDTSYRLYLQRGQATQYLQTTDDGSFADAYWQLDTGGPGTQFISLDVTRDLGNPVNNLTAVIVAIQSAQSSPVILVQDETATPIFTVAANGDVVITGEVDITGPVFGANAEFSTLTAFGPLIVGKTTIPADGDIAASEAALWFDDTNGASALKIKAKSADGTVVTATVPLT